MAGMQGEPIARIGWLRAAVLGANDGIALPATLERLAGRIPGAELRFYEGGHMFIIQDRAAVRDMIAFLNA